MNVLQVSPQKPSSSLNDFALRAASAIVMMSVALTLTWYGGWPFAFLWVIAAIAIVREWLNITRVPRVDIITSMIAAAFLFYGISEWFMSPSTMGMPRASMQVGVFILCVALSASILPTSRDRLWLYLGVSYALVIAIVPSMVRNHASLGAMGGLAAVLWIYAVVWVTDIGAYFSGRLIGGAKLWPAISPKKTWAGFIGGVMCGACAGVGVYVWFAASGKVDTSEIALVAIASLLAAMVGQGGDLGESALKRFFDVKDASHIIPGHGGVMDRLDAFWAVCVIVMIALMLHPYLVVQQ